MKKHRAIPPGFMTVGQIAKKAGVTVRTLQYYDKEGVLSPSAESEGGRRLYTHKDIVKLQQIQSMKYLGFSLEDIKIRLPAINTPAEVSALLTEQAKDIRRNIKTLKDMLFSVEKLKAEVVQMEVVDWEKYADIVGMLYTKNSSHWVVKHLSDNVLDHVRDLAAQETHDINLEMGKTYQQIIKKSAKLQKQGYAPESEQGQALAKEWWDFVMKFTKGDMVLLADLMEMGTNLTGSEWENNFSFDKAFLENALTAYFTTIGYNPYTDEEEKHD